MFPGAIDRSHPLGAALADAAVGGFPDDDRPVRVVPPPDGLRGAVVAFTGCTFVAADVSGDDVFARLGENPLVGPVLPSFLAWLADEVGGSALNAEVVLAALGTGGDASALVPFPGWREHERAAHGARHRREADGWVIDGAGVVLLGRGVCGRWEVAYECDADAPAGTGRRLARAALDLVPEGEPLFAQVAPGHARSLRAALAAGYRPVGSEVLVV